LNIHIFVSMQKAIFIKITDLPMAQIGGNMYIKSLISINGMVNIYPTRITNMIDEMSEIYYIKIGKIYYCSRRIPAENIEKHIRYFIVGDLI
jgi:hypothetical protein